MQISMSSANSGMESRCWKAELFQGKEDNIAIRKIENTDRDIGSDKIAHHAELCGYSGRAIPERADCDVAGLARHSTGARNKKKRTLSKCA